MEFFDKLSKKVGEVYQGAKTKTEEVSQEFKLKNEIDFKVEFCPKCGAKQPINVEVKETAPTAAEETEAEVTDVNNENN